MPTYEYRCPNGHEFELFQRMSDEPVARCPVCEEQAERQLSAGAGLLFKGSGFYITDYRDSSYKKAAEKDSGSKSGGSGDSGSGAAGESKKSSGEAGKKSGGSASGSGSSGGKSGGDAG